MFAHTDMADPYPGRCHCMKFNPHYNVMQYERCLGYADKPHICHWPNARPNDAEWVSTSSKDKVYPPWVAPEDETDA